MKLAVIVEYFPPRMGSDRRIYELMRRLSGKNEVEFLVVPSFRESTGLTSRCKVNGSDLSLKKEHARIHVHRIDIPRVLTPLWKSRFYIAYLFSMIILEWKITRKVLKTKPDIIVVNYPSVYTGLLGFVAAKLSRRVFVTDFSDLIAQYTAELLGIHKSRLVAKALVLVQNMIVKNSDGVISVTDYLKKYAVEIGGKAGRIFVVPNGCDLGVFDHNVHSDYREKLALNSKKVCMYCGRLDNWAGSNIILEVAKKFENLDDDVSFVVVGNQEKRKFKTPNIVALDETEQKELPKIMRIADVMIVPFPKSDVSEAASPIKLFEAMAMKKTVVASRVAGIEEVMTDGLNGLLVEPTDSVGWVDRICRALDSAEKSNKIGRRALDTVRENYQWQQLAEKLENCLTKILVSKNERASHTP